MSLEEIMSALGEWLGNTAAPALIKVIIALIIIFISFKIINALARRIEKLGESGKLDKTIAKTFAYISKIGLKILVAVCMIGYVGIDTSGIAAVITSFGVCAGLALNGALSNLAGGVMIILTRPFKVDDYIEAQGHSGTVEEIRIISTKIRTPDNKVIYIPNGTLSSGSIINYSEKDTRRVDFTFSVSYAVDFERAKSIIMSLLQDHELVLEDPAPYVRVSAHSASSIDITARAWVKKDDYWTVNADIIESVKKSFDAAGIEIPFNQLDVHVISGDK